MTDDGDADVETDVDADTEAGSDAGTAVDADAATEVSRGPPYEAVAPAPDGASTAARFALTACEYSYGGIVCRSEPGRAISPATAAEIEEAYGVDVIDGIEIRTSSPGSASGAVGNHRSRHTLVCVRGGSAAMNRFAAEEPRVDVLTRPMAGRGDVNHVIVKAAARNGVRVEFDLGPVLRTSGGQRVRAISDLRKLRELVVKYDAPYVVSAGARSHLALRAPREIAAVGERVGFPREWVTEGLREWGALAARNRALQAQSFIEPGVTKGRYDEDT